jgi:hypothetical protein
VRELRCADFHDRYLIGEDRVYGLGSSLNGVGKNMTTLIHLPDLAAQTVRAELSVFGSTPRSSRTQTSTSNSTMMLTRTPVTTARAASAWWKEASDTTDARAAPVEAGSRELP